MFCRNCGKEIPERSAFCTYCGEKISSPSLQKSVPGTTVTTDFGGYTWSYDPETHMISTN